MGIEAENIRAWQGKSVVDPEDNKIGDLEAIYVDTGTDEPAFATVVVGGVFSGGKRLAFVPLVGAVVAPEHVRVSVHRELAKNAPSIDTDGELAAADEPAIFEHYGLVPSVPGAARRLARR